MLAIQIEFEAKKFSIHFIVVSLMEFLIIKRADEFNSLKRHCRFQHTRNYGTIKGVYRMNAFESTKQQQALRIM